ncbi:MAG: dephospho-CoA kinase, partial [Acidaminococcaceae bacterium]
TGGIASGKSTVAALLAAKGAPIFDADAESRTALLVGTTCYEQVLATLGSSFVATNGEINRPALAELVFHNPGALQKLENIIHSYVWQQASTFVTVQKEQQTPIVVLDVPLLIECGWHQKVDEVWLVAVTEEEQVRRAMLRSNMTRAEVCARIAQQMTLTDKKKYATVIIDNSGTLEATKQQVNLAWKQLL